MNINAKQVGELVKAMVIAQKLIKTQSDMLTVKEQVINLFLQEKPLEAVMLYKSYLETPEKKGEQNV